MDLWVVAAAAGAGYLAKYWQNFSNEKEGSLSLSGESKPRNLLQQIQERNGPFRRLRQKQLGIDDILGSENLGEIGDLATGVASTNDFDGKGKAEFSGNSDNLTDVLTTQETRFKRHKAFRSRRPLEYSIKPLDSLESCVASQLYREHENMNEYEFSSLPSPYTPTVRPLLATDGSRVISRVGGGSFRAELQFESEKKKLHKGDGTHLEENETLLGLPPLPSIGSLQLPWKLKQNVRKGRVQRSSSPGIRASSEAFHSQGSPNGMFLFFLGITIGVMATLVASKREVDKLNEQLKQTENLVEDLHEELEMKDFLTVKDLTNEGFESMKTNDCSFNSGIPTSVSLEQEFNRSTKFNAKEPDNQNTENSELISKIEAELEAELERLEQNMKASSSLERLSDFVGLDPDFIADVVQGELRVDTLNRQPGEQSDSDLDVSGSSTHHSANYAVSPRELSLRLHEVIQSRLEARIIELEAALQNNQKRPHSMRQESIISTRELYSEVGSLSTQESPIFMDEGTNHPMVINLSGETLEAYNEACEEISKMLRTGEEVPPETIYNTDHIKEMHPFDRELSLGGNGGNGGSIMHQDITGERWLSRNLVCDMIRSWEERTSRSWGSNEVGESEDDEEDEMGKLLIKQIVEKTRQGSAAVLHAQRMLYSMNDQ
ncbi:hypothetical protein VitviT2T_000038 [Vitis vinifera]|uniref:Uncharacterized protein n=2 Tax=Vitis vinifera TaxID=29760 RepID=F6HFU5_VITVI|nr:uncharacterized protein LOC100257668 [Vitis vinifera]XP_010649739.1 uncharacterized protein LOC100257668 [Vitis vinifera]XP_010649745.1 uncharacterized protein LOC100257668 [Vitis vinifera]RVX02585.1 hypothetical protein CK203_016499 [Vitis vinifera]WJZ80096.1 hypothetical protein VitviT2T_000038 [Vitis vinifera]|eukprot:XP_010649735.1 PREDICTED: uncharacterized protein LOC100257668 [Vitis vinifera]